jgi:stage IV sporulation protein B
VANASVVSIEKSRAGYAGELKALPNMLTASSIGDIEKNSELGVYGKVNDEWVKKRLKDEVAVLKCGRFGVKSGNAKILAQVNNEPPRMYDIKIIKASKQKNTATRGMVIKITDKELLSKTGGIVQGMSGSPILQDGKLVGAVTHLFLNDPTRGYGVYADFMLEEN